MLHMATVHCYLVSHKLGLYSFSLLCRWNIKPNILFFSSVAKLILFSDRPVPSHVMPVNKSAKRSKSVIHVFFS